jgi:hypothetical protein
MEDVRPVARILLQQEDLIDLCELGLARRSLRAVDTGPVSVN